MTYSLRDINWILWIGMGLAGARALDATMLLPTTTLAAETQNNTSTSPSFVGTDSLNGNPAPGNVSQVATRSLLYPHAETQLFVNLLPWFCLPGSPDCSCDLTHVPERCNSHILSGYNSNDAVQIKKQVDDMQSRGIQGALVSWYGPAMPVHNGATLKLRDEAERRGGQFHFAIMDVGQQNTDCIKNPACDLEAAMIADLTYAAVTYFPSPAYFKTAGGDPILFFFDPDGDVKTLTNNTRAIDWNKVAAGVASTRMQFIFLNAGGFTHAHTSGAFSWPQPTVDPANPTGFAYLTQFYQTAQAAAPGLSTFASVYKGFNDTLAGWSPAPPNGPRVIAQQCGQTWLRTFGAINATYASEGPKPPLPSLQIATWNDYDEGTALETGIDNCLSITATTAATGNALFWNVQGDASTLDHFTVFASSDGVHLMVLEDNISVALRSLDLSSFALDPGTTLRVKAVGKPSLWNHLSNAATTLSETPVIAGSVDLSAVRVYPNPWNSQHHADQPMIFDGLPPQASVKIFTLSGHEVKSLSAGVGSAAWDLTNTQGQKVASGVYFYLVTAQNDKKTGQVAVIR